MGDALRLNDVAVVRLGADLLIVGRPEAAGPPEDDAR